MMKVTHSLSDCPTKSPQTQCANVLQRLVVLKEAPQVQEVEVAEVEAEEEVAQRQLRPQQLE